LDYRKSRLQGSHLRGHGEEPMIFEENAERERVLICPRCQQESSRRSRRRGSRDYLIGIFGLRPWRCRDCDNRFYAWSVPLSYVKYAHCRQCGNMDLHRISGAHGEGTLKFLWKFMHVPCYRCVPCRRRFFTIRARRNNPAVSTASAGS